MKKTKLFAILILTATALFAERSPKTTLVSEIMYAYGVEETLEATRVEMLKQATSAMQGAIDQIKTSLPGFSDAGWAKIHSAADKYMKTAVGGWDGASLTKIYAKAYEDNYTLEELKALSKYIKTEKAKKSIRIEKLAAKSMNESIMATMLGSIQPAIRIFMSEVQSIVREEVAQIQLNTSKANSVKEPASVVPTDQAHH